MAKNPPDERLVYLALKGVFKGENSKIRNAKPIRKLVSKHKSQLEVDNLIKEHNIDSLCNVAKTLLEQQIFESTLKAKIRFPEVFEVSPSQSAERAISEKEAVRSEQVTIESVTKGQQDGAIVDDKPNLVEEEEEANTSDVQHQSTLRARSKSTTSPSLYPVYLTFEVQHQLLVRVQQILESAIYEFAQKKLGGVLQREGWDCAEAVELNRWPRILQTYQDELHLKPVEEHSKSLSQLLDSITQIRHTAVHRVRRTANTIVQFIVDAESFVKLLRIENYMNTISMIRRQTQYTVDELERNKDLLESRLAETRKQIAAKRAELERQEKEAMVNLVEEDREYMKLAGATLIEALNAPATVLHSQASTEVDADFSSDADFDEQSVDEVSGGGHN